jgi:hypothetical protein
MSATFDINVNDFLHYPHHFLSLSITLASLPFYSLVVPWRLLVGSSKKLFVYFHSLHCSLLLVYFWGLGSVWSINSLCWWINTNHKPWFPFYRKWCTLIFNMQPPWESTHDHTTYIVPWLYSLHGVKLPMQASHNNSQFTRYCTILVILLVTCHMALENSEMSHMSCIRKIGG